MNRIVLLDRDKHVINPAIFLGVGVVMVIYSLMLDTASWVPVTMPVDFLTPTTVRDSFTARPGGQYLLGLTMDDSPISRCWLNADSVVEPCPEASTPADLYFDWEVTGNGQPVILPPSDRGFRGIRRTTQQLTAMLGTWKDSTGATYHITFSTRARAPDIAALAPTVVVELGPRLREVDLLKRAAVQILGGLLVLGSLISLARRAFHTNHTT